VVIIRIRDFLNWYVLEQSGLGGLLARAASVKLSTQANECRNVQDYVDLVFDFRLMGFRSLSFLYVSPVQVRDEIAELTSIVASLKPKAVLEIGTANGGTLFLWSMVARSGATIVSVDLPGGPFGGGFPEWKATFYKSFGRSNRRICLVRGDSHSPTTLHKVKGILGAQKLNFLFLDGDHSYKGVKAYFDMYSPLVRKGGIVAFHDIMPHSADSGCEVSRFWNEVKHSHKQLEIVKPWNQEWGPMGIGLLFM
jgi:predicted O-methyltransferase YrrM